MKGIILARVSTEEQMNEGQSIPAQLARAREYVARKGFEVQSEHQFDESSLKDHRKKFEKVMDEITKSKEPVALVVETIDRLQRSFKESVMLDDLRKTGQVEIHFLRENLILHRDSNSSELLRWDMGVMFARGYVLQISDNVKRTIEQKLKRGEKAGKAPFGYLNTDDGNGGRTIVIDEKTAHQVKRLFEFYSSGNYSMQQMADLLNKDGVRGKMGAKWRIHQIETLLNNPFYYGQMVFKGQLYPHKYPPLISYDVFKRCREVRDRYTTKPTKQCKKPFILRGLMTCERCGCTITPEMHKGRYIYYHCTNYKGNCEKVWVNENELLKPIKEILKKMQLPQSMIDKIVESLKATEEAKNNFQELELQRLRKEYDMLENRISVMYNDRLDGRVDAEMYDKKLREFKEQQNDVLFKIKQFDNASESYYITASTVLSLAKRAEQIFNSSEPEEKRQLLNFLFLNLKLDGKNLLYKLKTPFEGVLLANTTHNWGGYWESNPVYRYHKPMF